MKITKKAVLDNLSSLISGLAVVAIVASIIFLIIAETQDQVIDQDACNITTYWYNSTSNTCCINNSGGCGITTGLSASLTAQQETQAATSDIPSWIPIVIVAVIGGLLLGLVRFFRQ